MIAPYSFHEVASDEFNEAAAYYDTEHRGLGSLFIDAVVSAIDHVREYPESCAVLRDRNRRMLVHGFPYSLVYSFVDGHVRILAVAQAAEGRTTGAGDTSPRGSNEQSEPTHFGRGSTAPRQAHRRGRERAS